MNYVYTTKKLSYKCTYSIEMLWKRVLKYKIHMVVASQTASSHLYLRSISTLPNPLSTPVDRHCNPHLPMHLTSVHKLPLEFSHGQGRRNKPGEVFVPRAVTKCPQLTYSANSMLPLNLTFWETPSSKQAMGISFLRPHKGSIQSRQDSMLFHSSSPHLQSLCGTSLHSLITMVLLLFFLQRL